MKTPKRRGESRSPDQTKIAEIEVSVRLNWLMYGPKYRDIPKGQKSYLIANVAGGNGDTRYGHNKLEHQFAKELVELRDKSKLSLEFIRNEGKACGFNMHASIWHRLVEPETCPTFEHAYWIAMICKRLGQADKEGASEEHIQRIAWIVEQLASSGLSIEQLDKLLGEAQLMRDANVQENDKNRGIVRPTALP